MDDVAKKEFLRKRKMYYQSMSLLEMQTERSNECAKHWKSEAERIEFYLDNSDVILRELKEEFEKGTNLNSADMAFLFFAVALQCARWLFQPKVDFSFKKISSKDRHNASIAGAKEFRQGNNIIDESGTVIASKKYPDKKRIFLLAVPYDAMEGTEKIVIPGVTEYGKRLYGGNHHAATLGHDPLLGYIFGTINILSRTITFNKVNLETNMVHLHKGSNRSQYVGKSIGFCNALNRTCESISEDITRLPAAVLRQHIHMESDKYTKDGLPIPFVPAEKAQSLLKQGWNSNEMERLQKHLFVNSKIIGEQALFSTLINLIIESIYMLTEDKGNDLALKEAKCRKVLMYSNTIASSSNLIYTAISGSVNNLDIGGFLVTLRRIANDSKTISLIKEEFIYGGFERKLTLQEFQD